MSKRKKLICTIFLAATCLCAGLVLVFATGDAPAALADEEEQCLHDYSEFVRTVEPTCTDDGYDIMRCSKCGETSNYYHSGKSDYEEHYQALGHLWDEEENIIVVAPTCTESGITYHYCPRCGETYTEKPTNATGHQFGMTVFIGNCYSGGYTLYVCSRCYYSYRDDYTDPREHDLVVISTSPANCTERGETCYECAYEDCDYSYTAYTDPLGHAYVDEVVEPGCEAYGYTVHTCSRCGDSFIDSVVAPYGHLFDGISQVVATESSYGYVKLSCSVCGYVYITNIVSPGEDDEKHDFYLTKVPADCYGGGYWIYECTGCGAYVICNETDPLEHEWEYVFDEPTCTEDGGWYWVCVNCGDRYLDTFAPATGHNMYVSASAEPTCTEDGYTVYGCRNCSYTYMEVTQATGHIYEVGNVVVTADKTLSLTYTCYSCSLSAISRLYVVFTDENGDEYPYDFDQSGVADFSSLPDGFYTASVYDAVTGEVVCVFVTGESESSSGTGSPSGDSGESGDEEHVHSYVPSLILNTSAKTVTISYKCSCGDDLTDELYVTFVSEDGAVIASYSADAKGVVSYAELDPGTYSGYVYCGDLRVASFSLTVPGETTGGTSSGGTTSSDDESGTTGGNSGDSEGENTRDAEHVHEYEGKITIDVDSMTMTATYECSCGESLTDDVEVAILDDGGGVLMVYYPDRTGFVDFSEDVSGGEYYVVVFYGEDVVAFETMKIENTSVGDAEDGGSTVVPSTGETSDKEEKSGNGTIIALLVVFLVVVAGGITAWVIYKRRSKKKKEAEAAEETDAAENLDDEDVTPSDRNNANSGNRYFDDDDDDDD